jgi:hypothetical protein
MARNRAAARIPLRFLLAVEEHLGPSGEVAFHGVLKDDLVISAMCTIRSGETAHALSQGSDPAFHGSQPTDLLLDECLADAERSGVRSFDFMASPAGDASLVRFKEKWGGRPGEALTLDRGLHPLWGPGVDMLRRLTRVPALGRALRAIRRWSP